MGNAHQKALELADKEAELLFTDGLARGLADGHNIGENPNPQIEDRLYSAMDHHYSVSQQVEDLQKGTSGYDYRHN
mgnify:CR=1 FL=1